MMDTFAVRIARIFIICAVLTAAPAWNGHFGVRTYADTGYSSFDQKIVMKTDNEKVVISASGGSAEDAEYIVEENVGGVELELRPSSSVELGSNSKEHSVIRLRSGSSATVIINGDITMRGGHHKGAGENTGYSAIRVEKGASLKLVVNGSLKAYGGDGGENRGAAAIGGDDGADSGEMDITVNDGGELYCEGADGAAGIGGGDGYSANKPITINMHGSGRLTSKSVSGGSGGGAGIGGGDGGSTNSSITINMDGTSSIEAVGVSGGAGIGGGRGHGCGDITIDMSESTGANIKATGTNGAAGIGGGDDGSIPDLKIKGPGADSQTSVTAAGGSGGAGIGGASDGKVSNVSIDGIGTLRCTGGSCAAGIGGGDHDGTGSGGNLGTVSVTNCGYVEAAGGDGGAGIGGGEDDDIASVTVENCGEVRATGGRDAAGIGTGRDSNAGKNVDCGPVTVKKSKVTAACPDGTGAGIGCGRNAHVTEIIMSGEKDITATGHGDGSGIGYAGSGTDNVGGHSADQIYISEVKGKLTASAGSNGAGIGVGDVSLDKNDTDKGSIKIYMSGGSVNATAAGTNNAGIGGGRGRGGSNISRIIIKGSGTVTAKGTQGGAAIGSGDDANVEQGIDIEGSGFNGRDLTVNVSCSNTDHDAATCPLIGIDDPADKESDRTDITIRNANVNCTITRADGRNTAVCIGGGEDGGTINNQGGLKNITIDNCNIRMSGDAGVGIGGNQRVSVDTISISNTDYDGFAIGSMGYSWATILNGEITSYMNHIIIKNSNVKAIAKYKQYNESYVFPMAGIGGGNKTYVGDITIDGSEVEASGILGGAGIGGGGYLYDSSFSGDFFTVYGDMGDYFGNKITINRSNVKATGSEGQIYEYMRPGIGFNAEGEMMEIEYKTRRFCGCGAGIGGGGFQSFREIEIDDSTVEATGAGTTNYGTWLRWEDSVDTGAAGIGGGTMGTSDRIAIERSTVTATGTTGGAGIGSGGKDYQVQEQLLKTKTTAVTGDIGKGDVPEISIMNCPKVTAYGGFYGAGIGCGELGRLKKIDIAASNIEATGGEGAAGIGGGTNTDVSEADVRIYTGQNDTETTVTAAGGTGGAGIGSGVSFDKNNKGGTDIFGSISVSGEVRVFADGGCGAAGIGGGSGGSGYLADELHWDGTSNRKAGTIGSFSTDQSYGAYPLVAAAAGENHISDNPDADKHDVEYTKAATDIGRGASFTSDENSSSVMKIAGGTVLSTSEDAAQSMWDSSYRAGASVNALAKDRGGKHLDRTTDPSQVYRVKLRVPGVTSYTKVRVTVNDTDTGTRCDRDASGELYYNDRELYTDEDGWLWLWLREGRLDSIGATVVLNGQDYDYRGDSSSDNKDNEGVLKLQSAVTVSDSRKIYDGEPPEDPPVTGFSGGDGITYTYYTGYDADESIEDLRQRTPVPRESVKNAGEYTVLAELAGGDYYTAAACKGRVTIEAADTAVTEVTAVSEPEQITEGRGTIRLTAQIFGLVPGETGTGKVRFTILQDGSQVKDPMEAEVGGDGTASCSFEAVPAGAYTIMAKFLRNDDLPNYNDSKDYSAAYETAKLDVQLEMDAIRAVYGDGNIMIPDEQHRAEADILASEEEQTADDRQAVEDPDNYTYELADPDGLDPSAHSDADTDDDTVSYSDGSLTVLRAGLALMKVEFKGTARLAGAVIYVPVVISRKEVTAHPKVSLNAGGPWKDSVSTTFGRTLKDRDLFYTVVYTSGTDAVTDDELAGTTEAVPVSVFAPYSETPYPVGLVRKAAARNYKVIPGEPASVKVDKALREFTVTCADVTYGEFPRPQAECSRRYLRRELSYHYTGTDNSGGSYDGRMPPHKAGTYRVTGTLAERDNFAEVSSSAEFEIKRAAIDPAVNIENHEYGEKTVVSVFGNKGNGAVSYTYYRDRECTVPTDGEDGASGLGGEPVNAGIYYVVAHVGQTADYEAADTLPNEFRIIRRQVRVKAEDKNKNLKEPDPVLTAQVTGLVGNDEIDYTIGREPGEEEGVYRITPSGKLIQGNYRVEYSDAYLTIGNSFTLFFDLNGGTMDGSRGVIRMSGLRYGQTIKIPGPPKRKGYSFLYWKGSKYYPGDNYTVESSHGFKAVWKKKTGGADTGDGAGPQTALWTAVLILSAMLLACLTALRIRRRRQ